MIDFTKAFDTVNHIIILSKLIQLNIPTFIVKWICSFLSGRGQECKINGLLSNVANIGLGIVDNIEQLNCSKLLGVLFQSNLKMDSHVQYILSQCVQRMYLIKLLQHKGMPWRRLSVVTYSIVVPRILYALSLGGFPQC